MLYNAPNTHVATIKSSTPKGEAQYYLEKTAYTRWKRFKRNKNKQVLGITNSKNIFQGQKMLSLKLKWKMAKILQTFTQGEPGLGKAAYFGVF